MQLTQGFSIPEEVNEETAKTVEEVVKYFASQRSIMNKVVFCSVFLVVFGQSNWNLMINPNLDKSWKKTSKFFYKFKAKRWRLFETVVDKPDVETDQPKSIFDVIGSTVVTACAGKTKEEGRYIYICLADIFALLILYHDVNTVNMQFTVFCIELLEDRQTQSAHIVNSAIFVY